MAAETCIPAGPVVPWPIKGSLSCGVAMSEWGPGPGLLVRAECPGKLRAVCYGGGNMVSLDTKVNGEVHG